MKTTVYEIFKDLYKFDLAAPNGGVGLPKFPPFNVKKTGENTYLIEFAVAGYTKQDIEIEFQDGNLKIKSEPKVTDEPTTFLWKGIAQRAFEQNFKLAQTVEIKNATLTNGMLKIFLENIIPESQKPKKIVIEDDDDNTYPPAKKEYLAEKL